MTQSKSSLPSMLALAMVALLPAGLAVQFAPSLWTVLAAAGAAIATTGLLIGGFRRARTMAMVEGRERGLQSAASSAEARSAMLEARMREAATIDDLTGVLNRRTFVLRLDESLRLNRRPAKPMAFLLVDIAGLKKINAEAGRMIGDRVLRAVGKAIQSATRGTDVIGRIGGDEFAVLLTECVDPHPAIDRIFVALYGETTGGANSLPVRVSVGAVTIGDPAAGVDPVQLFGIAEEALASVQGAGLCNKREYRAEAPRPVAAS
jgi:diguanylate cyclase (GGDEF)-like protein